MEQNYYINVYEEYADGTWQLVGTRQTREEDELTVKDGIIYGNGRQLRMSQEEAKKHKSGRYFEIAKSEPILDYVIGTFDLCRFSVKNKLFETRFVIRVQLVNTRNPYYFIQEDGKNWRLCDTVCDGTDMQKLRKNMDKYINKSFLKEGVYTFQSEDERKKFESLF